MFDDDTFRRSMSTAVDSMWLIEGTKGTTVAEVKEQERIYRELHASLIQRYGRLADLIAAANFDLDIDPLAWPSLTESALGRALLNLPKFDTWLSEAQRLSKQECFFHWDLEFPEVFFDRHGRPLGDGAGFDAVVGNPPYVRQERLSSQKRYLAARYPEVYDGVADLFVFFIAQGADLLKDKGRLSYISSNSWIRANYAESLRKLLRTQLSVEAIIDLGDTRVFSSAPDVYPAILSVTSSRPRGSHEALVAIFRRGDQIEDFQSQITLRGTRVSIQAQPDRGWQLVSKDHADILRKLNAFKSTLDEIVNGRIYYGIKTGDNEVFIVDSTMRNQLIEADPTSAVLIKPLLQGEDLRPWYQDPKDRWIIFARRGIDIESYPAIRRYLEQFRERLEPRPSGWDSTIRWPGRKPGSYRWYELQDSVDYFAAFEEPKLVYPDIAKRPRVSWNEDGSYLGNTAYAVATDKKWLLGYLSSRCAWYLISQTSQALGERAGLDRYRLFDQFMRPLITPEPSEHTRELLASLSELLTSSARIRHDLERKVRRRTLTDLGSTASRLNQRLSSWWTLDFPAFRAEVKKALKNDIPVKDRDDWEEWLNIQRAEHDRLTAEIVRLETELNAIVYRLFDLSPAEIELIEKSTGYRYGEV